MAKELSRWEQYKMEHGKDRDDGSKEEKQEENLPEKEKHFESIFVEREREENNFTPDVRNTPKKENVILHFIKEKMEAFKNGQEASDEESGSIIKPIKISPLMLLIFVACLVCVTVVVTYLIAYQTYEKNSSIKSSNKIVFDKESVNADKIAKFQKIIQLIEQTYALEYDENELLEGAINGMIEALGDKYSSYYKPGEMSSYNNYIEGTYIGLGFGYEAKENGLYISKIIQDSPAAAAGLAEGDIILTIDQKAYSEWNKEELYNLMSKEGTKVNLTWQIADGTEKSAELTVAAISKKTVFDEKLGSDLHYIRITQFTESTGTEFEDTLQKIYKQGCAGIILDLRHNGGGLAGEGADVADSILPEGVIATSRDKSGAIIKTYDSRKGQIEVPIVLLINQKTASASELVAGAFRDFKKGTIVGTTSVGKALGQRSLTFASDNSGVTITVAKYYTPSGECIQGVGITPNVIVELEKEDRDKDPDDLTPEQDLQMQKALEILKEQVAAV